MKDEIFVVVAVILLGVGFLIGITLGTNLFF